MLSDDERVSGNADSPTGVIPRPSLEEIRRHGLAKESPQPPLDIPELEGEDPAAITGQFEISAPAEGEDHAKHADDNPTKSASKS